MTINSWILKFIATSANITDFQNFPHFHQTYLPRKHLHSHAHSHCPFNRVQLLSRFCRHLKAWLVSLFLCKVISQFCKYVTLQSLHFVFLFCNPCFIFSCLFNSGYCRAEHCLTLTIFFAPWFLELFYNKPTSICTYTSDSCFLTITFYLFFIHSIAALRNG